METDPRNKTCEGCIWEDQCSGSRCEDYSPANDTEGAFTYYDAVLAENAAEYQAMIEEYLDR